MTPKDNHLSIYSKVFLFISAIALVVSIFVPIWRIDLDAPQYPEGLRMLISANGLGGDVEIINGLNHYIGMKTLHNEDFIEFTVLPYIIGFFALFALLAVFVNRKKVLYILFSAFVLFGILAMYDFWRWEYEYGHDLDPNAAIVVPGMAYQPPLIGFKQLLNFGAYSIPDIGGWLFIGAGALMLLSLLIETNMLKLKKMNPLVVLLAMWFLPACGQKNPEPIKINKDNCAFCKMTIADKKFGTELITPKNRVYKFDDVKCMVGYVKENPAAVGSRFFVPDYLEPNALISVESASFIKGGTIESPMAGNIAAFGDKTKAEKHAKETGAKILNWNEIMKK